MKLKYYQFLLLLLCLSFVQSTYAQKITGVCGVTYEEGKAIKDRMLDNRRNKAQLLQQYETARNNDSTTWVPIQFHIVNKTDGTGGEKIEDVLDNLCLLNSDYESINVQFYLSGPIRFINQDLLYTNDFGQVSAFYMGMYKVDGVVNVFIGNQIQSGISGGTTLGYYTPGLDVIYCIRGSINGSSSTLTHEVGHLLSLPHTFFGWEGQRYDEVMLNTTGRTPTFLPNGAPVEEISRSGGTENCQIAADGFCDTDANYLFGFYGGLYNNGCEYAATAHDPNGYLFRPDVIAPSAVLFKMNEADNELTSLYLRNLSTKDKIYRKTLVVLETVFTDPSSGTTTVMWSDTIGTNNDTDYEIGANSFKDIIGNTNAYLINKGFIQTGSHTLTTNVTCSNANAVVAASLAEFEVNQSNHVTSFDSIRVTNASATDTIFAGTVLDVTESLVHATNGTLGSETWQIALPNNILPNGTELLVGATVTGTKSSHGGMEFEVTATAPYPDTSGTTSENIMSYYNDGCVFEFSKDQGEAMKLDIIARGYPNLYATPNNVPITDTVIVINPVNGAAAPNDLIQFVWNPVNGATMYQVSVYATNIFGLPLVGGYYYESIVEGTDFWLSLPPGVPYAWTIKPISSTDYCDDNLRSTPMRFTVNGWTVNTDQIQTGVESVNVYPNPVSSNSDLLVEINAMDHSDASVEVYNSLGQRVMNSQTVSLIPGANVQKLNMQGLSKGLYMLHVTSNGHTHTQKIQVQ